MRLKNGLNNSKKSLTRKVNNMEDIRIFREGEIVIIHDGSERRSGIELAEVAEYASYIDQKVLIRYGHFNTEVSKIRVHKAPASLKKALKELKGGKD